MLLVVNAGSSSVKIALFDRGLEARASGAVSEIGGAGELRLGDLRRSVAVVDHRAALALLLDEMQGQGFALRDLQAAAHRVVHGGARLVQPCRIDASVLAEIEACVPLAPLHNPGNLMAIRALAALLPELPQFASFDTAFHATNPEVALRYALPAAEADRGIRRYGFHGISYAGLVRKVQEIAPNGLTRRLLALHLGNGASVCAVLDGASVANSMGYSPLEGLTMGTRAGSIDGNAVLRLAELHGIEGAARILNRESGLLGLGGASDMRALMALGTEEAAFARAHFAYWLQRHAGSMLAAMGGLDAIAFTGGIGENDADLRAEFVEGLAWAGRVPVYVIAAEEERTIAAEALGLLGPA
jgi:acetate kinase